MSLEEFLAECSAAGITRISREADELEPYGSDESHYTGHADAVIVPRDADELTVIVRLAYRKKTPLTVVAAKSSVTGAPVPQGGAVVDLRKLNRIDPDDPTRVGPGRITGEYKEHVADLGYFYPPDPTSLDMSTIGGNVACNASGALSYLYGPTRDSVEGLRVVLGSGHILDLKRGDVVLSPDNPVIPHNLPNPPMAEDLTVPLPGRKAAPWSETKTSLTFFDKGPLDLVDLFIGTEGTLGVIVDVKTRLLPKRNPFFAVLLYLPSRSVAVEIVALLHALRRAFHDNDPEGREQTRGILSRYGAFPPGNSIDAFRTIVPSCMEWSGSTVGRFVPGRRGNRILESYGCLYVEQELPPDADSWERAAVWSDLIEALNASSLVDDGRIDTEVALDARSIRALKSERQAVPERLNEAVKPGLVKTATDFSVPREKLGDILEYYDTQLADLDCYVFGHIGNAHVHVNVLPQNRKEYDVCMEKYERAAQFACELGGSVTAEHGIGKLKHRMLEIMLGKNGVRELQALKKALDPRWILNPGTLVPIPE